MVAAATNRCGDDFVHVDDASIFVEHARFVRGVASFFQKSLGANIFSNYFCGALVSRLDRNEGCLDGLYKA